MEENKSLPCFVLTFAPEEMQEIKGYLRECGYPPDSEGLHELICDIVGGEVHNRTARNVGSMAAQFLRDNPEILQGAGGMLKAALKKAVRK